MSRTAKKGRDGIPRACILLSIDFDVWHPGYACGFAHCGFCKQERREWRYAIHERERPTMLCQLPVDSRVPPKSSVLALIPKGTPVYAAECHAEILRVIRGPLCKYNVSVVDLDHHLDNYITEAKYLHCGNWITIGVHNGDIVRYSRLMTDGIQGNPAAVFTCKSSPYLLRCADGDWLQWLSDLEEVTGEKVKFIGWRAAELANTFRGAA